MLSLLCAFALGPVRYDFNPATHLVYDVRVVFDGFIPILGGHRGSGHPFSERLLERVE